MNKRRGWPLFSLGLLVAILIGGSVRILFSSQSLTHYFLDQREKIGLPYEISLEEAQLLLSKNGLPRFGLEFVGLDLVSLEECARPAKIHVDKFYLPISFKQIWTSDYMPRKVHLSRTVVTINSEGCTSTQNINEKALKVEDSEKSEAASGLENLKESDKEQADSHNSLINTSKFDAKKIKNLVRKLDGLRGLQEKIKAQLKGLNEISVQTLEWHSKESGFSDIIAEKLRLKVAPSGVFQLSTNLEFSPEILRKAPLGKVKALVLWGPDLIDVKLKAPIREGIMDLSGVYKIPEEEFSFQNEIKHIPTESLFDLIALAGLTEKDFHPKFFWLSCSSSASGNLKDLNPALHFSKCGFEGDVGKVFIENVSVRPFENVPFEPFVVQIDKIDLKKFINAIGRTGPSGILSHFGLINGKITVKTLKHFIYLGELKGLELYFSNKGQIGKQKVKTVNAHLELKGDRFSGLIDHVELDKGEFKGLLSFNLDQNFKDGLMQVKVDELGFHPSIQRLMINGEVSSISAYGKTEIKDGEIHSWEGAFGSPYLKGKNWSLDKIKIHSNYKDGQFKAEVKAENLKLSDGNDYVGVLMPLNVSKTKAPKELQFENLSTDLEIKRGEKAWSRLRANLVNKSGQLISSGRWSDNGFVLGHVQLKSNDKKIQNWDIKGTLAAPTLIKSL